MAANVSLPNTRRSYDFGAVRAATLTLPTLTALSGQASCGVVTAKFSGQADSLRSSPAVFADTLSGQITERYSSASGVFNVFGWLAEAARG